MPSASGAPPSSGSAAELRIGYLIPEFPGQTHIWMWREIVWMRRFGATVALFSTRPPPPRDGARHAFAEEARKTTFYLVPMGWFGAAAALLWGLLHPWGLLRSVALALTLPVDRRPRWKTVLPLVLPACRMAREARKRKIRRFHAHSCANSAILCMMARRLTGIPFSMTLHGDVNWWGGALIEKIADAEFMMVISRRLLDDVARLVPGQPPGKSLLGPMGVDTETWTPHRRPAGSASGRLLSVGRLHFGKGHDTLIEAAGILARSGMKLELRIVGEGPQRIELEHQVARAGLKDVVRFCGSLSELEIIEHMKWADVFALASHAEALGVVYMEAMAMQVATIGTRVGGVGEIITDGVDGLLVPPKDPPALADAIRRLLTDDQLRVRLALAARKTIVDRFDSRIGAATLYERIMGQAPPASTKIGNP
jgi:glycosyltransferase involved in cell wall biosynthesis